MVIENLQSINHKLARVRITIELPNRNKKKNRDKVWGFLIVVMVLILDGNSEQIVYA